MIDTALTTKQLVLEAFDTLFNRRDYDKAATFWSPNYIQHSAFIRPGRDGLFDLIRSAPDALHYEHDRIVVEGDYAMVHGRFSGNGRARAWIAVDIVRIEDGRLAEHWDVLQDEVTATESLSGKPMFGSAFSMTAEAAVLATPAPALTIEDARRITAPLYDALNQPATKDVAALLAQAAHDDYRSFSTNENSLSRDQLAGIFYDIGVAIPDLGWTVIDIITIGNRIIVRGKATGTPTGEFFGQKPTGESFDTMSIDIFTVRDGKLASAYHIENWAEAFQQLNQ